MFGKISTWLRRDEKSGPIALNTRFPMVYNLSDLETLYKTNVVVYKCVSMIARSISSISFYLRAKTGEIDDKFDNLLSYPNVDQCQESFFEELVTVYLLYGSVYCYRTGMNELMSLKIVKPTDVEIITKNGKVDHYIYRTENKAIKIQKDPLTGDCDLLCIRGSYMSEDESPYKVITKSAELYNQIIQQTLTLLQNKCRPSGILYVERNDSYDNKKYDEMIQNLQKWLSGENAGEAFVMSMKHEWKELGLRPSETNFIENKESAAKEIAQAFGVPYVLLSQDEATYANYREARKHFWEDTVLPLAKRLCSEMTAWLFHQHHLQLSFNVHMINALGIANKIQTINEQRMLYGYPAIEGGDRLPGDREDKNG